MGKEAKDLKFRVQISRNDPQLYPPTVDEICDTKQLKDWIQIIQNNVEQSLTSNKSLLTKVRIDLLEY